ncbi:MAG: BPSS1780 family membrane protein [Burkholderiales bacterium]
MRVVPAKNGWKWLLKGFDLFRRSAAMWLFLVITYWIGVAMLGQIPYVGLAVSTALLPAFSVSFMAMCAAVDAGGALQPALLFSGFRRVPARMLALGVLYLVSIVGVLATASVADAGALLQWVVFGREPALETLRGGSVSQALMLAAVAGTPVLMAFWFAPVLAAWGEMGAAQSLFYSFFAVWRNWRAFCVYGAMLALAGIALLTAVTLAAVVMHGQIQALRFLALVLTLLTLPIVFGSFYASYRDIFPESAVPADMPAS